MITTIPVLLLSLMPAVDAPVVGRPREHFYGAVGEQVRVEMKVSVNQLRAEDPLDLTLVITGAANPEQIERPDLTQLPDFARRFHIDDVPEDAAPKGERVFRYRLRPKNERVRDVPPLLFHYWNPRLHYFATTATRYSITLDVQPRNASPAVSGPLEEPEFLFELPSDEELRGGPTSEEWLVPLYTAAMLLPPLLFLVWYAGWRLNNPNAARLAQLRRSRAVREALDLIAGLHDEPGFGDELSRIMRAFLHDRSGLPNSAATPPEVAAYLEQRGSPTSLVEQAQSFFLDCDEARFGPESNDQARLIDAAKRLVLAMEESA